MGAAVDFPSEKITATTQLRSPGFTGHLPARASEPGLEKCEYLILGLQVANY